MKKKKTFDKGSKNICKQSRRCDCISDIGLCFFDILKKESNAEVSK